MENGALMKNTQRLGALGFAIAATISLVLALDLSACENVASYTQSSMVRVIDASYNAPAIDVIVEGVTLASNIGEGYISSDYGTLTASSDALIKVVEHATPTTTLLSTNGTISAGKEHSILITDNGASGTGYTVNILEDQSVEATTGHSTFRFINESAKITNGVDIYVVPFGSTLAATNVFCPDLATGAICGYQSFASQTVTIYITAAGSTTSIYAKQTFSLTGGEVYTVLLSDTQLTSNPAITVSYATDNGSIN